MNLPRFTAEASLYKTSEHYAMANVPNSVPEQAVQMSRAKVPGSLNGCLQACSRANLSLDGYSVCSDFCRCVYKTDNSVWTCFRQAIEDQRVAQA